MLGGSEGKTRKEPGSGSYIQLHPGPPGRGKQTTVCKWWSQCFDAVRW